MKLKLFFLTLFTFAFLLFTCAATATTRFVSKTGSSVPPYTTWATASDSIQKAINICNDGDTVYVANGVYKEYLRIYKDIALIGSSMDSTVIDGRNLFHIIIRDTTIGIHSNAIIKNFNIIGYGIISNTTVVKVEHQDSFFIENCKLSNANRGISCGYTKSILKNLLIVNVGNTGMGLQSLPFPRDSFYVQNCVIELTLNTAIAISCVAYGYYKLTNNILLKSNKGELGIFFDAEHTAILLNNLISGFKDYGAQDLFLDTDTTIMHNNVFLYVSPKEHIDWTDGRHMSFRNNILAYNSIGITNFKGVVKTDYNIYWGNHTNVGGNVVMGSHDLIVDPMFVKDVAPHLDSAYDFHLQKHSPGIDAGDPDILDVDGSRSDIGLFGGPLGETYTYQDLAPRAPRQLQAVQDSSYIKLTWKANTESDFYKYILYRDTIAGFSITKDKAIYTGSEPFYNDLLSSLSAKTYYYKVTATDSQKNQSAASAEISVTITGVSETVIKNNDYLLYNNYPNPFNPTTKIGFHLKERAYVKLLVYNINGELIEVLVNEEKPAGYHEAEFNAIGKQSEELNKKYGSLASGIYLYRIEVMGEGNIPVYSEMKKMILLK